jgi:aminopeptidase
MSDNEFMEVGVNCNLLHKDFMIGSSEMDVDGITEDNSIESIMRGGELMIGE